MKFEFTTSRLNVVDWRQAQLNLGEAFYGQLLAILTPEVTKALPDGWQNLSAESIEDWFKTRSAEGEILTLLLDDNQELADTHELAGLLMLYADEGRDKSSPGTRLHIGYLLGASFQGKGLAKELLQGLITHCQSLHDIKALVGGVHVSNQASRHLLVRCGFSIQSQTSEHVFYQLEL